MLHEIIILIITDFIRILLGGYFPTHFREGPVGTPDPTLTVKVTNCRYQLPVLQVKAKQTSTGTSAQNKVPKSTGASTQKQTPMNTRIICRYNYLSTNYNHFRTICPDLQFG